MNANVINANARTRRTNLEVLRTLVAISPPPWRRLIGAMLLGLAAAGTTVGLLAGSGALIDRAALRPGLATIAGLLAVVEVLAVLRAPLRYAERLHTHEAAFGALGHWRLWLYDRLEPLLPGALGAWRSGDLLHRAIDDIEALTDLYSRAPGTVGVAVAVSALSVVAVGSLLPLGAAILGAALAVAVVGSPLLAITGRTRVDERALAGQLTAEVVELVQGAPELLAFGLDETFRARAEATAERLARLERRRTRAMAAASALVVVCLGVAVVGTLAAAVSAAREHRLEGIMIAVLPLTAIGAFEAVAPLGTLAIRILDVLDAGRRLLALNEVPAPVSDPSNPVALHDSVPTPPEGVAVAFDDATLRYRLDRPPALDAVSFAVPPGSATAILGQTGAGKSSIVNALLRFWPLEKGSVTVNATSLEQMRQADARRVFALLDQDARLFAGTIRQNVALGRPEATAAEIAEALRAAQLDEWVRSLPNGLETPVGESGNQVSSGQRRRIALARALLVRRPVLLLDEPTTNLDDETADALIDTVLAAALGRTVVLVTHRSEDLRCMDQILTLDRGRVVATSHR